MKNFILLSLVVLNFFYSLAFASTGEIYGYGSRAGALGNTILGGGSGGFGTFYNPAANSTNPGFDLSLGFSYMHPEFLEIKNVTIDNYATAAETTDVTGDMETNYIDHYGQVFAGSLNLGENLKNISLGVLAFLPVTRLALLDTGEPFRVEYINYRGRTSRPQVYSSLSISIFKYLHVAGGMSFGSNVAASTRVQYATASGTVSHQRFASTVKSSASPYASIYVNPKPFEAGLTVRRQSRSTISVDTNASARFFGNTTELKIGSNSASTIFYDPFEVDLGLGFELPTKTWVTGEVDWLQYEKYEAPNLVVTDRGSASTIQKSVSTKPETRNIFVYKVGIEQRFSGIIPRIGYVYRPSPISDNSGPGNLVDPDKHIGSLGLGFDLQKIGITTRAICMDLHGQYHHLVKKRITKSGNNEAGTAGQTKVGSPYYDIGGKIYGGGITLSMSF